YKLNTLHLHLTDDEGWRLEIQELPELTEIGAFRGHTKDEKDHLFPAYGSGPEPDPDNTYGSGYLSRDDFKEILRYANDRHVEVIPEFNFPGHARAAIKSMEIRYERLLAEGKTEEAERFRLIDPEDNSVYNSAQNYKDNIVCVCRESVFNFYTTVIDDVIEMYKEADVPLKSFHTGGDEVPMGSWLKSPMCAEFLESRPELGEAKHLQAYFLDRVRIILGERDLNTAGWEEIVMKKLDNGGWEPIVKFAENRDVIPYVWNNLSGWEDLGNRLLNAGFPVVLCDVGNFYFDLAYYKEGEEYGHNWGGFVSTRDAFQFVPYDVYMSTKRDNMGNEFDYDTHFAGMERLKPESRENILGLQGQLWSETIKGGEMLEYYYLPKMLGLAERAWVGQPDWASIKNKSTRKSAEDESWNVFANRLGQRELLRLDKIFGGYKYRIPLPGAIKKDGKLHASIQYPGLIIRYTIDGSAPDMNSHVYEGPIDATGTIKLKAFNTVGRGSRTSIVE
ncbi:family 20 glycosylhydrolase, partial [Bacteroidota bacterium]